jgi:hypothetical protein
LHCFRLSPGLPDTEYVAPPCVSRVFSPCQLSFFHIFSALAFDIALYTSYTIFESIPACIAFARRSSLFLKSIFRLHNMAGLVIMDSLGRFRVSAKMKSSAGWIRHTLCQYGLDAEVQVVGGLRFSLQYVTPGLDLTYADVMLHKTKRHSYAWVILFSGGNDVYVNKMDPSLDAAILRSMDVALTLAPLVLVVFGGSSRMWGYQGDWASEYDRRIAEVMDRVSLPAGARIITGADDLHLDDNDIADRIGHVRFGIGAMKVIECIKNWAYSLDGPRAKL